MIAYKALMRKGGKLYSGIDRGDSTVIEYSTTEPTKPDFGELFVFKKLKDAKRYAGPCVIIGEIWRAECNKLTYVEIVASDSIDLNGLIERFRLYWECRDEYYHTLQLEHLSRMLDTMAPPEGTYTTPELQLLTKVS